MSRIYQTVASCLTKSTPAPVTNKEDEKPESNGVSLPNPDEVKENDAPELSSDKKTDELLEPQKPVGLLWRVSSGLYNTTTGAVSGTVGMGVSGVKWAAGKGYDAGSAVVGTTKTIVSKVPVPTLKRKDKKE